MIKLVCAFNVIMYIAILIRSIDDNILVIGLSILFILNMINSIIVYIDYSKNKRLM